MSHRNIARSAFILVASIFLASTAHAQSFRAYLAPTGSDANPCTLQQPCRLLPAALAAVASGGEIWMLGSANYNTGPVNITKSVTILAIPGAVGSVVAAGGNAIDIATAGVNVALRNLVVVPLPGAGGQYGVSMTNGAALTVENCLFANLSGPAAISVSTAAAVSVTDTTIRNSLNSGLLLSSGARVTVTRTTISGNNNAGVYLIGTAAGTTTTADIADSTLDGNYSGVAAYSGTANAHLKVSIRDSRAVRNSVYGMVAQSDGGPVTLTASNNMISNNGYGIASTNAGAKVWATGNTVSDNSYGLVDSGGAIFESTGNNAVRNNSGSNITAGIVKVNME